MFKNLSEKFGRIIHKLNGQGRITEANIQEVLSDIRSALLEADVGLSVVKQFVEDVGKKRDWNESFGKSYARRCFYKNYS